MESLNFETFSPQELPFQDQLIDDVYNNWDYSLGVHEALLSGSVGSAKSVVMSHLAVRHCLEFNRAKICLCRMALPDLKETIFLKICEQIEGTGVRDFVSAINTSTAMIRFTNGSKIISRSFGDKNFTKVRSLDLSAAIFEELIEFDDDAKQAYTEVKMRIGRIPGVPHKWIISATNPDEPGHWVYTDLIEKASDFFDA